MKIEFNKEYLQQLYEDGKAKNKKYRFQKAIIKQYKNTIDKLRNAYRIEDIFNIKSLNYEKLQGDKKGFESVKVNDQYRVIFQSHVTDEIPNGINKITICEILELSKHYE